MTCLRNLEHHHLGSDDSSEDHVSRFDDDEIQTTADAHSVWSLLLRLITQVVGPLLRLFQIVGNYVKFPTGNKKVSYAIF